MDPLSRVETLKEADLDTPAFVIDVETLREDARIAREAVHADDTGLLLAMKSFSVVAGLEYLAGYVDGFAASSLFEVQLARRVLKAHQSVHVTAPGVRPADIQAISGQADYLSFNSLPQWWRFRDEAMVNVSCGLRVNTGISAVADERYDPCRAHSKLGIPVETLSRTVRESPGLLEGIQGLHFHTNCDSRDFAPLLVNVTRLIEALEPIFDQLQWINLGGGYLFHGAKNIQALDEARCRLRRKGAFKLYMEPGAAFVRRAGIIVASVVDLFDSGGLDIAVLDTTVNHMPEVFEYQFEPDVLGDTETGDHAYTLVGAACLAGDVFGEYAFADALHPGSRVIFPDMGAYSMVKANMFNGINLPTIYVMLGNGELQKIRRYEFEDYLRVCGA